MEMAIKGCVRKFRPEVFWGDLAIDCSPGARLLYMCLNHYTDTEDNLMIEKSQISEVFFPASTIDRDALFNELVEQGFVEELSDKRAKLLGCSQYFVGRPSRASSSFHASNRRAAKINATPAWACVESIKIVYKKAKRQTLMTGVQHHVDHIIPLRHPKVCGLHVPENLRVITAAENLMKSNKLEGF